MSLLTYNSSASWFKDVFGFQERSFNETRQLFEMIDNTLVSKVNGRKFNVGHFEVLSKNDLDERLSRIITTSQSDEETQSKLGSLSFKNIGGNVKTLIKDSKNKVVSFKQQASLIV